MPDIKVIATILNPVAGVSLSIIEKLFTKPKETVMNKLDGNKSYIGIIVFFVAFIAQQLGYDVPVEAQEGVTASLTEIVRNLGLMLGSIGLVHKIEKATK